MNANARCIMFLTVFFGWSDLLDFCFQKLKSATVPFHEAETDNNNDNNKKRSLCFEMCNFV